MGGGTIDLSLGSWLKVGRVGIHPPKVVILGVPASLGFPGVLQACIFTKNGRNDPKIGDLGSFRPFLVKIQACSTPGKPRLAGTPRKRCFGWVCRVGVGFGCFGVFGFLMPCFRPTFGR